MLGEIASAGIWHNPTQQRYGAKLRHEVWLEPHLKGYRCLGICSGVLCDV